MKDGSIPFSFFSFSDCPALHCACCYGLLRLLNTVFVHMYHDTCVFTYYVAKDEACSFEDVLLSVPENIRSFWGSNSTYA